ncbi:MAG: hypothetical protein HQK83_09980 [Fibrobacteria bacterium]|nr:hypothetical protein [Fibrobacteria bacterium]
MNYHFDLSTVMQLIHLVKKQVCDIGKLDWPNPEGAVILPFFRKDPPNEGNYQLVIKQVTDVSISPNEIKEKAVFQNVEYQSVGNQLIITLDTGTVIFSVRDVKISAIGQ